MNKRGKLPLEGTWYWLEMRNWSEDRDYSPEAFSIKIGDKRITYNGPMPHNTDDAATIFWAETGLKPGEWKLVGLK
jgi:hypothetical protein